MNRFLRKLTACLSRTRTPIARMRRPELSLETLEDRLTPAAISIVPVIAQGDTFFSTHPGAQAALQAAFNDVASHLDDTLTAIPASGAASGLNWDIDGKTVDPVNPTKHLKDNPTDDKAITGGVMANQLLVVVGGTSQANILTFPDATVNTLAHGSFGGEGPYTGTVTPPFGDGSVRDNAGNLIPERGHQGNGGSGSASFFAPWGGTITINQDYQGWDFGTNGSVASGKTEFMSTMEHELGHVLGYGGNAWTSLIQPNRNPAVMSPNVFTGTHSEAVFGGPVPTDATGTHWADGTAVGGVHAAMDPNGLTGAPYRFTTLDYAGLADIGWGLTQMQTPGNNGTPVTPTPVPVPTAPQIIGVGDILPNLNETPNLSQYSPGNVSQVTINGIVYRAGTEGGSIFGGNQIYIQTSTDGGNTFGDKHDLMRPDDHSKNETAYGAPALAYDAATNKLYVAWTGTDGFSLVSSDGVAMSYGHLNVAVVNTSDFSLSAYTQAPNSDTSQFGPSLAVLDGNLFLAYTGLDRRLNVEFSTDRTNFSGKQIFSDTASGTPTLVAVPNSAGGNLFIAWQGNSDGASHVAGVGLDFLAQQSTPLTVAPTPVIPVPNFASVQGSTLTINGDQLGTPYDAITVGTNILGGLEVTDNGFVLEFAPWRFTTVNVNAGAGANQINVLAVPAGVTVNVAAGAESNDTVTVGNYGSVQGVHGTVIVTNAYNFTALNIDDSADTTPHTATLNSNSLSGLSDGTIVFNQRQLQTLNVFTGQSDTINVANTPLSPYVPSSSWITTTLHTGSGSNVVNVQATSGTLAIVGNSMTDTVNIGFNGSVQGIRGPVIVSNPPGYTTLNIDDSADTQARSVLVTESGIAGLSPAGINYHQADLQALNIYGGSGDNYLIRNTPSNPRVLTTLHTGYGSNVVNVQGTTGPLNIVGSTMTDTVNVGYNGSVQGILGMVTVSNPPGYTTLNVDDSADPTLRTVTVTSAGITGLAPAAIDYHQADLQALTVHGGLGGDVFVVTSTPANPRVLTTLLGGAGGSTFRVGAGVQGRLSLVGGGGNNTLDYSASTTDVRVNLRLNTATGVSDGVFGIQEVIGGQGNNLLVGDGGVETLIGGAGHNLIIDGRSTSNLAFLDLLPSQARLVGGSGDNLIISDALSYVNNQQALDALFAEWSRTDETPAQRITHLRSGVGTTGAYALNSSTVVNRGNQDILAGGFGFNWFLDGSSDTIANRRSSDQVN